MIMIAIANNRAKSHHVAILIGLTALVASCVLTGCSGKGNSDAKTPQQIQDFKGHPPTPDQLRAAMNRTRPNPVVAGKPPAATP